jgi:hypothetical protein
MSKTLQQLMDEHFDSTRYDAEPDWTKSEEAAADPDGEDDEPDYVEEQPTTAQDGDVPGHEFHGNQHAGAMAKAGVASSQARKASIAAHRSGTPSAHTRAAAAHTAASEAHREALKTASPTTAPWHEAMKAAHEASAAHHAAGKEAPIRYGRNFGDLPEVLK